MTPAPREQIEIDLLLEAIYRRHGYDFRNYARASIDRRIRQFLPDSECASVGEMIPRVLHDDAFFSRLVRNFSIPVTEMFRDPLAYRSLRELVLPVLRTWSHFKVWHAGCATGEEVYSLAILLKEEGLYERATIYATDFNEESLERARTGIYSMEKLKEATRNYQQSGGRQSLSDYYHAAFDAVRMSPALRERVVFSGHNLASDSAFGEMHLVLCRNVLIYFDRTLQDRVLSLFTDSLVHGGFLCLGTKEDLQFSSSAAHFDPVDRANRLYKKRDMP